MTMFKLRPEHTTAFRKQAYRRSLARSFQGSGLSADAEDTSTEDLLVRDPKGCQTRFTFDSQGFISGTVSPSGRAWKLENDSKGRMVGSTNPAGLHSKLERNPQGQVTQVSQGGRSLMNLEYNPKGLLTQVAYPDRTARSLSYDPAGRITAMGDRRGTIEGFEYDSNGLLTGIIDGNGNRTQFQYGGWDRPERTFYADGSSESYRYNPAGLVERISTASNLFAEIEYNPQNRPVKLTYGDGEEVTFVYNENGLIVQAKNPEIETEYKYDEQNRVVLEKQGEHVVQYFHDEAGSLVGMTYPTGERVEFDYDEDLRLAAVKDWNGGLHRFSYGSEDGSLQVLLPGGLRKLIQTEATGLPSSVVVTRGAGGGSELFSFQFEYDTENRVGRFSDSQFGRRYFIYDSESQLVEVRSEKPERSESFSYDAAGNRTRANGAGGVFNTLNQLTRQGSAQCRYDARGNLVRLSASEGEWNYHYNGRNFLVRAEGPGGQSITFGYDAFGRRLWKRSGETEVKYVWAGEQLLREVTQIGLRTSVRDYLYSPGNCAPLATRLDGRVYSYHTDHLGTPRRLTDEKGVVIWSADYTAFGEAQVQLETVPNALRFPGQYFDSETGLHYNRFRYYSPTLGRYLSRDPVGVLSGTNLYRYANNDPINGFDAQGLSWWGTALSIAGAIVAGVVVAAVVVALAPAALAAGVVTAAAVILGGAAAGAVGFGLNEGFTNGWCFTCILKEMARGALIGALAALPFVFLPAAAGVGLYMLAGGASGAIGYIADWLTNPDAVWSWGGFAMAVGLGAVTAGLFRYLEPIIAARWGGGVASNTAATADEYGVAFFGENNLRYYNSESATLGREGKSFFFMPAEDAGIVKTPGDAARYTGRAPSAEKAYLEGGDIYGIKFPTKGMEVRQPTALDADGWPHFLEGGHTAVRLGEGPNAGYLINPTREFVVPGGSPMPSGSQLFKLGPGGEWIPMKQF
jgi:RHS repeat-associated protein